MPAAHEEPSAHGTNVPEKETDSNQKIMRNMNLCLDLECLMNQVPTLQKF